MLEFPSLLLGAKPSNTPALYSIMNYADLSLGTWYPNGGIRAIATGLYQNALDHNVEFLFNHPVSKIETKENIVDFIEYIAPAFELIDDFNTSYPINILSLIAENSWNKGVIIGKKNKIFPTNLSKMNSFLFKNNNLDDLYDKFQKIHNNKDNLSIINQKIFQRKLWMQKLVKL